MSELPARPGPALVEVSLTVGPEHAELAEVALGELSPAGFLQEQLDGGATRFAVYQESGQDPSSLATGLADAGIPLLDAPQAAPVAEDWAERWKEFHQPVVIGGLWVGPPWQVDQAPPGLRRVVIEPAQGFGTGAHPTTRLVLGLLQEQPRASVLDLGCGSGVLSVAAAQLGFGPVMAIDNDPVAVESTLENLARNAISGVRAWRLDALQEPLPKADIVLANVILEPLLRLAPRMTAPRLILSGLLRSQAQECADAYQAVGYVTRERRDRDGWSALVLEDAREDSDAMRHRSVW